MSEERPWHCQIHRDAFHYGDVSPNVDSRLIVDLRWFGIVEPRYEYRMTFSESTIDAFGHAAAHLRVAAQLGRPAQAAPHDEGHAARAEALGGFLPGSEPQFVAPGLPVHVTGTTRMGRDAEDSVVDEHSRVWDIDNLYLGGNELIPRGYASNPTLTAVSYALRAAEHITGTKH